MNNNMLNLEVRVQDLHQAIKPASLHADYATLEISENGVVIPTLDESDSAATRVYLEPEYFERYEIQTHTIGLNIGKIERILNLSDRDETAKITLKDIDSKLRIQIGNQEFRITLTDQDTITDAPENLPVDYTARMVIPREDFDNAVSAAEKISEYAEDMLFKIDEDDETLILKAEGDDDMTQRVLQRQQLIDMDPGEGESKFSIDLLSDFNDVIPLETVIHLQMAEDRPLKLNYELADGEGHVTAIIAPRIENN